MATAQANARLWHRFKLVSAVKDIPEVRGPIWDPDCQSVIRIIIMSDMVRLVSMLCLALLQILI